VCKIARAQLVNIPVGFESITEPAPDLGLPYDIWADF
jgi:hypothetical protein